MMHNDVRKYYNKHVEEEDHRLDNHPFEIPVMIHFVNRYLKKGYRLFDVACGTGRIAGILLKKGYLMGLNDISDKSIQIVKQRLGNNPDVLFIERSDAMESKTWEHGKWDGIFILGPMYHMVSKEKRLHMVNNAKHLLSVAKMPD